MPKPYFIALLVFASAMLVSSHARQVNGHDGANRPPNVIYILADDLGFGDLSCYGQKKFETPNIDALAKKGMKFTQHYSGSTVCAPSRCCLMTGYHTCLLYTSPSPRDQRGSRMPSSA